MVAHESVDVEHRCSGQRTVDRLPWNGQAQRFDDAGGFSTNPRHVRLPADFPYLDRKIESLLTQPVGHSPHRKFLPECVLLKYAHEAAKFRGTRG